jgi:predicted RNA-binding Zn-ribbon protein involved in translation (DUF1610 family)
MSDEPGSDEEHADFPCPHCGESRIDFLEWEDDESVKCRTCGRTYHPNDSD